MAADTRNAWCMPSSKAAKTAGTLFNPAAQEDVVQDRDETRAKE